MFRRILVANRGEIAVRIIRTLKEMGIETVSIYSDVDQEALHVFEADEAHYIGPPEPSESYLNIEKIIEIAQKTRCEAIHPGYGFLAENAEFAKACEESKIIFIGPPSKAIKTLGDKILARKIARAEGIPIIPGMLEATKELEFLEEAASNIGYPLIIKAAAGGGGKGMRIVREARELKEACLSAMREAESAFGDGRIYLERLLDRPRHIEFQVLADRFGNTIHLFERECSVQRRHQKILEETPSPALFPELREEMGKAAVALAKASGYVNAGTVEFLLDRSGNFYFLEVNTRLQVEHPVTEMTVGLDMVRHQVEIAFGLPLRLRQEELLQRGHAIQCRIYAEDPQNHFMPSSGRITGYREPTGPWIRVDSGVYEGANVPVEYDPILSKLVVWAEDRESARRKMLRALQNYFITGVRTTIPLLMDVVSSGSFTKGDIHIGFLEENFSTWAPPKYYRVLAIAAAALSEIMQEKPLLAERKAGHRSPWERLGPWEL